MARLLVVEDSPTQAQEIQILLEGAGFEVDLASNGSKAIEAIQCQAPDLILTDLHMPKMDGLQLVEAVRARYPRIPIVLMTAYGSEEIAAESLRRGAASYVPKRYLRRNLVETLVNVLELTRTVRLPRQFPPGWESSESRYLLDNDIAQIPTLINSLSENFERWGGGDDTDRIQLTIALGETLTNAIHHGNLELDSELREQDDASYHELAVERSRQHPYQDRRVRLLERVTPDESVYVIQDEGPGFNHSQLPDPTDPINLEKSSGRGLLLVRTFMDEVSFNHTGNQITLVKRLERPTRSSPDH